MPQSPDNLDSPPLSFEQVAQLAMSSRARVDLCRIVGGQPYGALVAVKRLPMAMSEDEDLRGMFRDEIWMTAALDHPNITKLLGWGEDEDGLYFAVEFVRGVSLARLMRTVFRTGEAFTERLAVFIASHVCAGLEHAHALRSPNGEYLSLVHRDLTPSNVLLGFEGAVKITDFGLAKAKQRVTSTAIGMTKGEPAYMSPEQVMGKSLDGRSDIFTLGIWLFELFAQRKPWTINGVKEAFEKIVQGAAPDLARLCPKIDPALVALVKRCLEKEPDSRFGSAQELKIKLDEWLRLHGYDENAETLGRFVRRNAMRQMRWLDRALTGDLRVDEGPTPLELSSDEPASFGVPPERESKSGPTDPTRASIMGVRGRASSSSMADQVPASSATHPTRAGIAVPPQSAMGAPASAAGSAPAGRTSPPMSNAALSNAARPNAARPNAARPNAARPNAAPPNAVPPNAPLSNAALSNAAPSAPFAGSAPRAATTSSPAHGVRPAAAQVVGGGYGRAPAPPPLVNPPANAGEISRPIDLMQRGEMDTDPPASGSNPDNAKTMRRRASTPQPHARRRDAAPPLGATRDSPVTLSEHPPATVAVPDTLTDHRTEEPSTLRRSPVVGEIHELVARLRLDAERLGAEARHAASEAHAAAGRAESASRAAHVAAAAAERSAEALRRATHAFDLAGHGDVQGAVQEAQRAKAMGQKD
jgi:eukaryotic-like serine/threonine-protein kinase